MLSTLWSWFIGLFTKEKIGILFLILFKSGASAVAQYIADNDLQKKAYEFVKELAGKTIADPLVNCPITSDGDYASMKVKLDDVFAEYSKPRMYGAVPNVDEAIKKEKDALLVAKVDKYIKIVQKQVDEFNAAHADSRETFKKEIEAAKEYKKQNPHKVNPKDYK